jgi:hypothetical protein
MALDDRDYHSYNKQKYPKFRIEYEEEKRLADELKKTGKGLGNYLIYVISIIMFVSGAMWFVNKTAQKSLQHIGENSVARQQQLQRDLQQSADQQRAAIELQKKQGTEQVVARELEIKQQPHYERIFVKAKSADECGKVKNVIDEKVIWCMKDHYERILVNGNQ